MNSESNTEMGHECKVKCTVKRGLFKEEYVAIFKVLDPEQKPQEAETIVDGDSLEDLKEEPSGNMSALLKAWFVKNIGEAAAVVLPQPTFQNGPSVLIPKSDIL
jgi:hypothetical protein